MRCRLCKDELHEMSVTMMFACFTCNTLFVNSNTSGRNLPIKRQEQGKWRIGKNPQLTKNQLWEQELEKLYENWITRRMLDE